MNFLKATNPDTIQELLDRHPYSILNKDSKFKLDMPITDNFFVYKHEETGQSFLIILAMDYFNHTPLFSIGYIFTDREMDLNQFDNMVLVNMIIRNIAIAICHKKYIRYLTFSIQASEEFINTYNISLNEWQTKMMSDMTLVRPLMYTRMSNKIHYTWDTIPTDIDYSDVILNVQQNVNNNNKVKAGIKTLMKSIINQNNSLILAYMIHDRCDNDNTSVLYIPSKSQHFRYRCMIAGAAIVEIPTEDKPYTPIMLFPRYRNSSNLYKLLYKWMSLSNGGGDLWFTYQDTPYILSFLRNNNIEYTQKESILAAQIFINDSDKDFKLTVQEK